MQPVDDTAAVHLDENGREFRRIRGVDEKPDMSGVRSALAQGNSGGESGKGGTSRAGISSKFLRSNSLCADAPTLSLRTALNALVIETACALL
ncbi:hypothetical protein GCM10020256_00590 [Streptomyces thermocoprophilus]